LPKIQNCRLITDLCSFQQKIAKERDAKEMVKREREKAKQKEKADKEALANAKKKAEEEASSKKLVGRMLHLLKNLKKNETPRDYTMAGLELGNARTRILACLTAYNTTLTTLHLARKRIQDFDGIELARMLFSNKTLRKLELEGNQLGP